MPKNEGHAEADATNSLIEEIKALRDGTEELFILLEHIWQNREDLRLKVSVVLNENGREAIEESLCCYECDAESPGGLAQALHNFWIDLSAAPDELPTNFVGWCPDCQRSYERESERRNAEFRKTAHNQLDGSAVPADVRDQPVRHDTNGTRAVPGESGGEGEQIAEPALMPQPRTTLSPQKRDTTPLFTRLYLYRHMEAIVRLIGYEGIPQQEATAEISSLAEQHGREPVDSAVAELSELHDRNGVSHLRLKTKVRKYVRGILGPSPPSD